MISEICRIVERISGVESVQLVGSRGRGDAAWYSDWDFEVRTRDFPRVAAALPTAVKGLGPLGSLWDPLSEHWCYMLMLRGPTKVDLIFDEPHPEHEPWMPDVSPQDVDRHFWDWIWWLATKDQRGRADLVTDELAKMEWFLLEPIGASLLRNDIVGAVEAYCSVRPRSSELRIDVVGGLRRLGYDL